MGKHWIHSELFTQQTNCYKTWLRSFASVDSPSLFLTINPCRPWLITCANFSKSGQFSTRFISETKSVTPDLFCISDTSNSFADCSKNLKKNLSTGGRKEGMDGWMNKWTNYFSSTIISTWPAYRLRHSI